MRRFLAHGLLLLLLSAAIAPDRTAAATEPEPLAGTVTWIYDADTLDVAPHGKVRLLGVDAPEKADSDRDGQFIKLGIPRRNLRATHGAGLAWCLTNVKGRRVNLDFDTRQERRDRHGRLLAYVRLPDGRLLNRTLLEEGLVIVYRRFPIDLKSDFLAAEAEARRRGVGLWASPTAAQRQGKTVK